MMFSKTFYRYCDALVSEVKQLRKENKFLRKFVGLTKPKADTTSLQTPLMVQKDMSKYNHLISRIKKEASMISLTFKDGHCDDGRLVSALKEKEYLERLKIGLEISDPDIIIEIPGVRCWYDVRINGIPINLKITTGSTDNAFNKTAIYFTITGYDDIAGNLNFNAWWEYLKNATKKDSRDQETEYHYLVVNKNTGGVLLKSILDIHAYKSNPSNILQINWNNEFCNSDYTSSPVDFKKKQKDLVSTIQSSVSQNIMNSLKFAVANLSEL